ncbi:DUF2254 domain-containing protein [Alkalilimnicola sp. S0819]|uniref:DUF2254 domain-containing protein n=1 Tax=Alkalilimnicola sp. S0819 TaxID=2613922 RepID=UPI0012622799|nr:DUF2254 domain-containing protein [Alkalilimnicola sp. S0819]KAB7624124.1 DUF2254 domain-containing protein [Alkalilimnicola sp. S0819]MPQ16376.1 DUF2254 domain-containing protein [Alkalilimnicola sp. S0819]
MWARMLMIWVRTRDSLWFIPASLTLTAAALAVGLVQADQHQWPPVDSGTPWLFGGAPQGARAVLAAIAGSLITVTGVVFSITIVALQLASSQFTPRLLRDFSADRTNQTVLGVFIATFTYALLVLRTVRAEAAEAEAFVPRLAVSVAIILVLVSIGSLIYFIHHVANAIRVSSILQRLTTQTLRQVARRFPADLGTAEDADSAPPPLPDGEAHAVAAATAGYLQAVDGRTLFQLGEDHRLTIRADCDLGDFLLPGQPLATVVGEKGELDEETAVAIRDAFVCGPERTPEQDLGLGIIEISDIALKALSPGINDPTTAMHCIDHLGQILLEIGGRTPPRDTRTRQGKVHFIARHLSFSRAVALAFDGIRHYGAADPMVAARLHATLSTLMALLPEARQPPLIAQQHALRRESGAHAAAGATHGKGS